MITLAFYNMKGGVGKTTTAVNLAHLAAAGGKRTCLWDLDPQGGATYTLGEELLPAAKLKKMVKDSKHLEEWIRPTRYENLEIIPAGFEYRHMDVVLGDMKKAGKKLKKVIDSLNGRFDYFIFDCPPSMSVLVESVFNAADHLIMPLAPTVLSQQTFEKVQAYLAEVVDHEVDVNAFYNMVDRRKTLHRTMVLRSMKDNPVFCENSIPFRADIERMSFERAPLTASHPDSDSAIAYRALWKELERRLAA